MDDNNTAQWYDSVLHDIVNYHSRSTQRKGNLEKIQDELGVKKLQLIKFVVTRWLCRGNVSDHWRPYQQI